ncbi:MAG TPA: hypothetical protein DDW94_02905 [Deltaproteobacteria bacterium]|nr:MAG: hypothetical protein A2Z79_08940 [Deltaproteobacteria bacterium GWA2_55_82]OGQ64592.1 MAG: hypothetical protein A3I81_11205 [Deltaproteobacteria bacterium RIFCSPLOWO2_02_FULL_55_12]OIJ73690.1 MAG: hypothetical protein A2V21_305075 [Deltaproteobacteria bacterium GWC2_55_46]HBG45917.1 hypothetical protein [Deltaproteobacteria bacterium]HCY09664.1 hypothetical protein [Deltaproteobacteria bacterium]
MGLFSKRLLNEAVAALKTGGFLKSLYWTVFGYAGRNEFVLFRADLKKTGGYSGNGIPGLELKTVDAEALGSLRENPAFRTKEAYADKYSSPSGCLVGMYRGEPAHLMWVFEKNGSSRFFTLLDREAEIGYCFTADRFRGKGIYTAMISGALEYLKGRNFSAVYMATHVTNLPAIKAITRAGFEEAGRISHYGIFHRPKWNGNSREYEKCGGMDGTRG